MEFSHWASLALVCLLGAMSPGPSLAVVMQCTLSGGRIRGFTAALAHGAGVALYGALTVTGLAVVITGSPRLFTSLQVLGALYLVYLGIGAWRQSPAVDSTAPAAAPGTSSAARKGFLVAFLNPKLAVFMLALFSQFLGPTTSLGDKGIMVATVGLIDAGWYCLIVLLVSHPAVHRRLLAHSGQIGRLFGAVLIMIAAAVLWRALGGG